MSLPNNHSNKIESKRRGDLLVAIALLLICIAVFIDSIRMTFFVDLPGVAMNAWLVSPGIVPLVLSTGLLVMISAIIIFSLRANALESLLSSGISTFFRDEEVAKTILQIALLCVFVFVLLGRVHFGVASTLYLFGAMYVASAGSLFTIGVISLVFSTAIVNLFSYLINIPLP